MQPRSEEWFNQRNAVIATLPDVPRLKSNQVYRLWFVYHLADPRDGTVFYIGCSANPRLRYLAHISDRASAAWLSVQELRAASLAPDMKIVAEFQDHADALALERRLIAATPSVQNLDRKVVEFANPTQKSD